MAGEPQGLCSFPGVQQIVSASMTLSHGITPSVCTMEIAPQTGFIGEGGTLAWSFGPVEFEFDGCKISSGTIRYNQSGQVVSLAIMDRRWKWAFGEITGHYNVRLFPGGDIDPAFKKTPQELAGLLLDQMQDVGYQTGDLPNDSNPQVDWEYVNPAQELADLCEKLGCRVVLQLDNTVAIRKIGVGADLPTDNIMEQSASLDPPERPDYVSVICGKSRFQVEPDLEAVGLDTDGSVQPIDSLSYKPAGGWTGEIPGVFAGVADTNRALAKQTVWRWYRIKADTIAGVTDIKFILPIEDEQVDTVTVSGIKKKKPAEVTGTYFKGTLNYANESTAGTVRPGFTIDKERGIVQFSEYLVKLDANNKFTACTDLKLKTAISLRESDDFSWMRHYKDGPTNGNFGTGARILLHEELVLNHSLGVPVNQTEIDAECDKYITAAEQEYQTRRPYEIQYAGLKYINPDGARQQVSWSVGLQGAITRASWNQETSLVVPSYKERRLHEQLRNERLKEVADLLARERKAK